MSIKISDIGLQSTLASLVSQVNSSEVYFIVRLGADNDFLPHDATYQLYYSCPAIGVKPMSAEAVRRQFGTADATMVRCTISMPPEPFTLDTSLYAILNFSDSAAIYTGKVVRVQPKLSSLMYVFIDTSHELEFDPVEVGVIV